MKLFCLIIGARESCLQFDGTLSRLVLGVTTKPNQAKAKKILTSLTSDVTFVPKESAAQCWTPIIPFFWSKTTILNWPFCSLESGQRRLNNNDQINLKLWSVKPFIGKNLWPKVTQHLSIQLLWNSIPSKKLTLHFFGQVWKSYFWLASKLDLIL